MSLVNGISPPGTGGWLLSYANWLGACCVSVVCVCALRGAAAKTKPKRQQKEAQRTQKTVQLSQYLRTLTWFVAVSVAVAVAVCACIGIGCVCVCVCANASASANGSATLLLPLLVLLAPRTSRLCLCLATVFTAYFAALTAMRTLLTKNMRLSICACVC